MVSFNDYSRTNVWGFITGLFFFWGKIYGASSTSAVSNSPWLNTSH